MLAAFHLIYMSERFRFEWTMEVWNMSLPGALIPISDTPVPLPVC